MLRRMRPQDVEAVLALCREHAAHEGAAFTEQGQASRLAAALAGDPPALYGWVVEAPDGPAGYMTATLEYSTWDARRFVHMDCLYLRPALRGTGLGGALLATLRHFALAQGCVQIQWQTPPTNVGAIGFYRALGAADRPRLRFYLALDGSGASGISAGAPPTVRAAP